MSIKVPRVLPRFKLSMNFLLKDALAHQPHSIGQSQSYSIQDGVIHESFPGITYRNAKGDGWTTAKHRKNRRNIEVKLNHSTIRQLF